MIVVINGEAEEMGKLIEEDLPGLPIVQVVLKWPNRTATQKANSEVILQTIKEAAGRRGCRILRQDDEYIDESDSEEP